MRLPRPRRGIEQPLLDLRRRPAVHVDRVREARRGVRIVDELQEHPLELIAVAQAQFEAKVDAAGTDRGLVDQMRVIGRQEHD